MVFQGQSLRLEALQEPGLVELCFDRVGESVNKFDARTVEELRLAVEQLQGWPGLRGVLVTSAKPVFIVGADITEFGAKFSQPAAAIAADVQASNAVFVGFEDLPVPTVVAINGFALGGGLEMALTASGRVMADTAQVGVPEVKLGLFPGFGGTVRLMRVAGPTVACTWVAHGRPASAEQALAAGVVDAVVAPDDLRTAALDWLRAAVAGEIDWAARQQRKREAVALPAAEVAQACDAVRAEVARSAAPHQPAAGRAIDVMQASADLPRDAALRREAEVFAEVACTQAAAAMVQTFVDEQAVKKLARRQAGSAPAVTQVAVLGAGIMGQGIAHASALRGVAVRLQDQAPGRSAQAIAAVQEQLARQVARGRLKATKAEAALAAITSVDAADAQALAGVDMVIEAVIEDLAIKRQLLAALEATVPAGTLLASNTSSLRLDDLAQGLQRPQDLVGLHFFNPVPQMPLVEVVRGQHTSPAAVARAVAYVLALGKTPIVVRDCPGFLVNRLLTAYMRGFLQLVAEGADFQAVDAAMEAFGWPMGPAYLEDVVGLDTGSHVNNVISAGYPERMPALADDALQSLRRAGRLGQKNGLGFYRYERQADGRVRRVADADTATVLAGLQAQGPRDFAPEVIVERLMLPLVVEAAHALAEGVVGSAAELEAALRLGLGFPAYAGGPLQYADWLGLPAVVAACERLTPLGAAYAPTPEMRALAAAGGRLRDLTPRA